MTRIFLLSWAFLYVSMAFSQNHFSATIKDKDSKEPLRGASVYIKEVSLGAVSDTDGNVTINNIPDGTHTLTVSFLGYETLEFQYTFPLDEPLRGQIIWLEPEGEELDAIVISTTRTSRTFQNTATRIEAVTLEEIEEKINMRPADVSMLLHESTGIRVQQTSATSANMTLRIQGLDGRYTQLLRDGYAGFGNFAGGLSILEIPPLDLERVEFIKGPASPLYGGGAIAGIVNFISKTPGDEPRYDLLLSQSHIGQTHLSGYVSGKNEKAGYTFLATTNLQQPFDVDDDHFTEIPKSVSLTLHPKFFKYFSNNTTLSVGNSFTTGKRTGGDIAAIKGREGEDHSWFEENKTLRNTTTAKIKTAFDSISTGAARASLNIFDREVTLPDYTFRGLNYYAFSDMSYVREKGEHTLLLGASFTLDRFSEREAAPGLKRNFHTQTGGLYAQHTWDIEPKITLESGLRTEIAGYGNDLYSNSEFLVLPRMSTLFRITDKLSSRIGGGLGYKTPTLFTEETEALHFQNVLPLDGVSLEKSYGGTADINYKTSLGHSFEFSVNQMFFYTHIDNATRLQQDGVGNHFFANTDRAVNSRGFETNLKLVYEHDLKLFVGYTYTDARAGYLDGNNTIPLTPKSRLNNILMYEKHGNFRLGLEGYYTDVQYLSDGAKTPAFWEFGFMAEKTFGKLSVHVNFENFTDVRQSRYKRVVNPPHDNPVFDEIWTHTEGFVFSAGMRVRL